MHKHDIDGPDGDILDRVYFCSDYCHRSWCQNQNLHEYGGWDGCHEMDYDTPCDACGDTIPGVYGTDEESALEELNATPGDAEAEWEGRN